MRVAALWVAALVVTFTAIVDWYTEPPGFLELLVNGLRSGLFWSLPAVMIVGVAAALSEDTAYGTDKALHLAGQSAGRCSTSRLVGAFCEGGLLGVAGAGVAVFAALVVQLFTAHSLHASSSEGGLPSEHVVGVILFAFLAIPLLCLFGAAVATVLRSRLSGTLACLFVLAIYYFLAFIPDSAPSGMESLVSYTPPGSILLVCTGTAAPGYQVGSVSLAVVITACAWCSVPCFFAVLQTRRWDEGMLVAAEEPELATTPGVPAEEDHGAELSRGDSPAEGGRGRRRFPMSKWAIGLGILLCLGPFARILADVCPTHSFDTVYQETVGDTQVSMLSGFLESVRRGDWTVGRRLTGDREVKDVAPGLRDLVYGRDEVALGGLDERTGEFWIIATQGGRSVEQHYRLEAVFERGRWRILRIEMQ